MGFNNILPDKIQDTNKIVSMCELELQNKKTATNEQKRNNTLNAFNEYNKHCLWTNKRFVYR